MSELTSHVQKTRASGIDVLYCDSVRLDSLTTPLLPLRHESMLSVIPFWHCRRRSDIVDMADV